MMLICYWSVLQAKHFVLLKGLKTLFSLLWIQWVIFFEISSLLYMYNFENILNVPITLK